MFKVLAGACLAALAAHASAAEPRDSAARFGALESVLHISLSPSGKELAVVAPAGPSTEVLYTIDLASGQSRAPILRLSEPSGQLTSCQWATDERIVCNARFSSSEVGAILGYTRMLALDSDGSDLKVLAETASARAMGAAQLGGSILAMDIAGKPDKILVQSQKVQEFTNASRFGGDEGGLGVDELDIRTNQRRTVEKPEPTVLRYISDEKGTIRGAAMQSRDQAGYAAGDVRYFYRATGGSQWLPLAPAGIKDFVPRAIDTRRNVAYGFGSDNGFSNAYSVSLDPAQTVNKLVESPGVDIDSFMRVGRQDRVVGASYAKERRHTVFFDEDVKTLSASIGNALGSGVSIVDANADESKLLLLSSSDVNPGMLYLFDRTTKQLSELFEIRPQLNGIRLAEMQPVSFAAADGTAIPAYLTLPPGSDGKGLPAIVMPHGGPSARDEWGFDWMVQYFALAGYAVIQPNYRGSAGFGEAWYLDNGFKSWRTAIGDVNDAGRWLVSQGIADPTKLAIVGWSYGGYAALQANVLDPALFQAAVAIAPVTDFKALLDDSRDFTNFRMVREQIGSGPHIAEGSPVNSAGRIRAPVLMFHGDMDENVRVSHARAMVSAIKGAGGRVEYEEFAGLDHYLSDSSTRAGMLRKISAFLDANLTK